VPTTPISFSLTTDLTDNAHLKALLDKTKAASFNISSELSQFATQPISAAVGAPDAKIKISTPASWTTATGITFSLTPEAACTLSVSDCSTRFSIAKAVDSEEIQEVCCGPTPGKAYINIDLDFSIAGDVGASGATGAGVCISGKASGSRAATLSYCHAVDAATPTLDALKQAFSTLAFPFHPDCALAMAPGDIARVDFDASLGLSLSATYGLASFKFSAPGADAVQQSVKKGFENLTLPTLDIEAGAKASVAYTHSDHFCAIVRKTDADTALLYLLRNAADDTAASVGVTLGVAVTKLNVTVDQTALAGAVNSITKVGGDQAAAVADRLQSSLVSRTDKFFKSLRAEAGVLVSASDQKRHTLLYEFQADLSNAALATRSWESFARADVSQALELGGLKLLPGSGVGSALRKSVSVGIHFFNFFSAESAEIYFQKAYAEIGPDGHIRYLYDIGKESDTKTKNTLHTSRIHFVASATAADRDRIQNLVIDLAIELNEFHDNSDRTRIASVLASLPPSDALQQSIAANPPAALCLELVLRSSAYQLLAGPTQQQTWTAYAAAARTLLDLHFIDNLSYPNWQRFNQLADGNPNSVPPSFYSERNIGSSALQASFFLVSCTRFLDLCTGLTTLAASTPSIDTVAAWNALLTTLTALSKDLSADWSRPATRAILQLCAPAAQFDATLTPSREKLTCTVCIQ
jgi:hypothetical protein